MNESGHYRPITRAVQLAAMSLFFLAGCKRPALPDQTSTAGGSPVLAQEMVGTWVHVGRPGQVQPIPEIGARLKFRTGNHWTLTRADASGLVVEHFGGTYTLTNNEYVETQDYGDERWMQDNGKSFKYIVKVEGDTMTQFGVDNPYTEVWKRAK